ncbi:TPA: ABC transporter ATP-binding protein [Streptococcus equi subsp. zooepidemicus]|uniref:ATP-binding cassette domain-containing protein n=1 Tax=Streptococcus equi TaxID=1336 RepID=UPI0024AE4AC7|nr:ABC transporter ATP-binding protein [Streptococcus equi]MDI5915851.1 ABC transporter ATP-binding protein [Streptococcus equi subsp. zooepidemicus]HEL0522300.1 ABC transporter ATP-binding protein [Streptococcus equi subsp. zooepidemicus]HEL0695380.1 ABC transporter ATP-binding protein [Streptococcus equi subsp. zooepidemicus]HEL0701456.1 ABC transporter ATP-binding protein [Streptococcus equi subsp. zooepidemicus]HEL0706801.1 ABC transporter ATP-binding protein [Streptococcus equi subsp. zoo
MKSILQVISKWQLCLYSLLALLYSLQGLLLSVLIQIAGQIDMNNKGMVLLFGLGGVAFFVFIYMCMYLNNILARSMIRAFNCLVAKKALYHFYHKQLNYSTSALNSFLTQDIPMFWQEYLVPLFIYPVFGLSILASVLYLLLQDIYIGIAFTIGGFLMIIPQFVFNHLLQSRGLELSQAREKSLASITDFTKGADTIQSNQANEAFAHHVLEMIQHMEDKQYSYYTTHNLVMFWTGPLKGIGLVGPLIIGLLVMSYSSLSLTTLIAMMTASTNLISPLQQLLEATSSLQSATAVKEKMVRVLALEEEIKHQALTPTDDLTLDIYFKRLDKYFDHRLIFQGVDGHISAGHKALLTGASGSGKSTLFALLCGEDKDYSGAIYFEAANGKRYFPSYDVVSLIHQRPYIFEGSLRDNLTLFQDYSDQRLKEILQQVHLWNELNEDLDLHLDGQNLSGGQIMKLEIARCLLRLKPILLADEVTAALDKESAREIRELLHSLPCTMIEIAHKYDVKAYDCIYHLKDKKLVRCS